MDSDRQTLINDIEIFMNQLHDPRVVRAWIAFYHGRLMPSDTAIDATLTPSPLYYIGSITMKQSNWMYLRALHIRLQQLEPDLSESEFDNILDWVDDDEITGVSSNDTEGPKAPHNSSRSPSDKIADFLRSDSDIDNDEQSEAKDEMYAADADAKSDEAIDWNLQDEQAIVKASSAPAMMVSSRLQQEMGSTEKKVKQNEESQLEDVEGMNEDQEEVALGNDKEGKMHSHVTEQIADSEGVDRECMFEMDD